MLVPGASVQRQGQTGATLERVPQAGLLCIYTLAAVFGLFFAVPEGARAPRIVRSEDRTLLLSRSVASGERSQGDGLALALPESQTIPARHAPGAFVALPPVARPALLAVPGLPLSRAPPRDAA